MYFPTEPGVAVPAWRVLIWQPVNAYYVIVDAETGTMLWRKNITEDQTQSATYSVYANPNAMINVADNPFPLTPGPTASDRHAGRGDFAHERDAESETKRLIRLTITAGLPTAATSPTVTRCKPASTATALTASMSTAKRSTPVATLPIAYNPSIRTPIGRSAGAGSADVAGQRLSAAERVTQMFYIMNWYHDELYRLGFTEAGAQLPARATSVAAASENDRVSEAKDRILQARTTPTSRRRRRRHARTHADVSLDWIRHPDVDGNLDADVIIHEVTHGTSNRLHGNTAGLSTNMSRGMGEGWGDFYAHVLLSEPTDPINGIYTTRRLRHLFTGRESVHDTTIITVSAVSRKR